MKENISPIRISNGTFCFLLLIFIFTAFLTYTVKAQEYPLLYENDFEGDNGFEDFEFTDATAWRLSDTLKNKALELFKFSNYEIPVSSPFNIAVLKAVKVGSFILEVDIKQTSIDYPHRDLCLFLNMRDPTNYYYVHISSTADAHAHSIFLVNDEPLSNLTAKVTKGIEWGTDWHKVRIERDVNVGYIKVYIDDMTTPAMEAVDKHFDNGYIGFGSFDDTGMFDNIKLWGNEVKEVTNFFKKQ